MAWPAFPAPKPTSSARSTPYARVQRAFLRQTINLGGDTEKVDDDFTQFDGTRSTDRLVLTVGRFGIIDIFDTNRYANSPKSDFLNWSLVNAGSFDYAADALGYNYGAAAEWYHRALDVPRRHVRPLGYAHWRHSPIGVALDPTFQQFSLLGEIERRYELWGQPGKIKITGFLNRGNAGNYNDAVALAQTTGLARRHQLRCAPIPAAPASALTSSSR